MQFGICVMADIDEIGFHSHAEALGYDSIWVADSQMLFSDCYLCRAGFGRAPDQPHPSRARYGDRRHAQQQRWARCSVTISGLGSGRSCTWRAVWSVAIVSFRLAPQFAQSSGK